MSYISDFYLQPPPTVKAILDVSAVPQFIVDGLVTPVRFSRPRV